MHLTEHKCLLARLLSWYVFENFTFSIARQFYLSTWEPTLVLLPGEPVRLRGWSVEEFKFRAKQADIYEPGCDTILLCRSGSLMYWPLFRVIPNTLEMVKVVICLSFIIRRTETEVLCVLHCFLSESPGLNMWLCTVRLLYDSTIWKHCELSVSQNDVSGLKYGHHDSDDLGMT